MAKAKHYDDAAWEVRVFNQGTVMPPNIWKFAVTLA